MLKKFIFLFSLGLILLNCSKSNSKLYNDIYSKCNLKDSIPFEYNLNDFIKTDWDTLYVLGSNKRLEDVDRILGFHYEFYEELSYIIVFVKNKKVIYHEEIPYKWDYIDPVGGGLLIYFPCNDNESISKVSNKTPVLNLIKGKNSHNEDCFYIKSFK